MAQNGGKLTNMSSRIVEIEQESLEDIEGFLVRIQVQMEHICALDLSNVSASQSVESQDSTPHLKMPEALRVLASKHDNIKLLNELVLLKLRNIIPRPTDSEEDVRSNLNLKRSRPLSPLYVPRLPSVRNAKLDDSHLSNGGDSSVVMSNGAFRMGTSTAEHMPLKYIKTGDNTKAPFQKPPSNIFMPTPKLAIRVPMDPASELIHRSATEGDVPSKPMQTTKKRTSRSNRDRNRTRNEAAAIPEPVMQTLNPGDTHKIPDDGHLWRKYGNKNIKTASYKRGYYKCRNFKDQKCMATKIVQQMNVNPNMFSVQYKGEHTCTAHTNLGPLSHTLAGGGGGPSLAEQINREGKETDKDEVDGVENWPENSSDSSEDLFPSDAGEDAVESQRTRVETPTSPLLEPFEMASIPTMGAVPSREDTVDAVLESWETVSTPGAEDFKVKYQPELCLPEEREIDFPDLEDCSQLLKMIGDGLWENPSDINWYHDVSELLSPLVL